MKKGMSQGALSLALLLGGVNAACGPAPSSMPSLSVEPVPGAPIQVWRAKAGRRFTGRMVVAGETIFGGSVDRKVYAVALGSGQMQWSSRLGGTIGGGVLVSGDTVFAASSRPEGRTYALDAKTGRRFWRTSTGPVSAPLALIDSALVAETQRGEVIGLSPATGAIRWRRKIGTARIPAIPADSGTLIVATVDSLFRLRSGDGKVVLRVASPGAILSPWLEHEDVLVAGTGDSLVVAIDRRTLLPRWRVSLDAPVLASPAGQGDTLYAASRRGTVYRIVADSAPMATAVASLDWPVTAPLAVVDGLVLLGGADGVLRALRPDGAEAWRLQLRWPIELVPMALDDGLLAVGGDGDLHRYRK
jgi:outer membrane protein assembly factor BamB